MKSDYVNDDKIMKIMMSITKKKLMFFLQFNEIRTHEPQASRIKRESLDE